MHHEARAACHGYDRAIQLAVASFDGTGEREYVPTPRFNVAPWAVRRVGGSARTAQKGVITK